MAASRHYQVNCHRNPTIAQSRAWRPVLVSARADGSKRPGQIPSDITLTRAYISDADAFNRNADTLARELGPQSSANMVKPVSLAAEPDFFVEIEAVATLNSSAASAESKR